MLSTGYSLFVTDNQENVTPDEFPKITAWENREKETKLAKVGKGWPRRLLSKLLSKDPSERPHSWSYVLKQLGGDVSDNSVDIKGCSVYHLSEVLLPACNQALQSQLANSSSPLGSEPYLQRVEDGTIWHMVHGYTKSACSHHRSSYVDGLERDGLGVEHFGDSTALLSYSWYFDCHWQLCSNCWHGAGVSRIAKSFQH